MEHRELKRLVQLMNENGLVELEIEEEGRRILLRKAATAGTTTAVAFPPPAGYAPVAPYPAPVGAPAPAAAPEGPPAPPPGTKVICSPMVGTFYRRPSPDSEAYVDVGSSVDPETVVCIVEAMKVNNEIKAEMRGEIVEVLVEDAQPVEFDQPLFRVKVA